MSSLRLISSTTLAALGGVALGGFAATTLVQTEAGEVSVQTNPSTQLDSKGADLVLAPLAADLACTVAELQRVTCARQMAQTTDGWGCSAICHQVADNPKQGKASVPVVELGGDAP